MQDEDTISKKDENNYLTKKEERKENENIEGTKNKKEIIENLNMDNEGKNKSENEQKELTRKDDNENINEASNKNIELSNQDKNNIPKNEINNHINLLKLIHSVNILKKLLSN